MISLNWVKDYIDINDQDLNELAVKITKAGINVEAVISNKINNLVIGEVVDCIDHPDSDHLHVCQVNVGEEIKQIVCGASNVRKGIKVVFCIIFGIFNTYISPLSSISDFSFPDAKNSINKMAKLISLHLLILVIELAQL